MIINNIDFNALDDAECSERGFGNSIKFSYINVDESQDEAAKYSIRSIPAVVIVKDGAEVNRLVGVQSEMAYSNALNELL